MRSQLPGASCVELPDIGHEVLLEEADPWRAAVSLIETSRASRGGH
jgi:hypothetical protein